MERSEIELNDLEGEQRELAELVGMDIYLTLVRLVGGSNIYIAKECTLTALKRKKLIVQEFNGNNYRSLALKYKLTERQVRNIVNDYLINAKRKDKPKQLTIFDIMKE